MQIWAETGKSALPIRNYSHILYQFLMFTQNLKRSRYILDIFNKVFGGILLSISFFLLLFYFPGGILLIVMNGISFICSVVTAYYTLHLNSLNFYIEAARKVSIQKHMEELED